MMIDGKGLVIALVVLIIMALGVWKVIDLVLTTFGAT